MEKVILLKFNFLIPSLRYIYFFTRAIKTHITPYLIFDHFCSVPISVFAQRDIDTAKLNNIFQTFLTCAEIFLFSQGMNVKSKVPILLEVLDNYDLQNLVEFFDAAQTGVGNQQLCHHPSSQKKKIKLFMQLLSTPKSCCNWFSGTCKNLFYSVAYVSCIEQPEN